MGLLRRCAPRNNGKRVPRVIEKDLHYYEPASGHGLKHDPFNAIIAPRPIGWISSRDAMGNVNLAPYSFFNGFNYHPPIIGFSSTSWKDSVGNIQETGEFVWNLATMDLAQQMNATAAHVAHDVSEFNISGPWQACQRAPCRGKPGLVRMQAVADHSVAGRRWQQGAGLAHPRRSRHGPYRQGLHQGRRLPDRDGAPDRARRPPRRLFRDPPRGHVRDEAAGLIVLVFSLAPLLRGRDERSSLLKARGEGPSLRQGREL